MFECILCLGNFPDSVAEIINDEYVCPKCYDKALAGAEEAYQAQKEGE